MTKEIYGLSPGIIMFQHYKLKCDCGKKQDFVYSAIKYECEHISRHKCECGIVHILNWFYRTINFKIIHTKEIQKGKDDCKINLD